MSLSKTSGVLATHIAFERDPAWSTALARLANRFSADFVQSDLLRAIHETPYNDPCTVYEAHAIAKILTLVSSDVVAVFRIPLLASAANNPDVSANQRILNELPDTFYAEFHGNQADADGIFGWKQDFICGEKMIKGPGRIPLEVGTTHGWTTWEHITFHGGVARLPYGCSDMYCFIRTCSPSTFNI